MHCTALLCCHLQLSHVLSYSTNSGSRIDCDIHGICNHDSSRKFSARYINWEVDRCAAYFLLLYCHQLMAPVLYRAAIRLT